MNQRRRNFTGIELLSVVFVGLVLFCVVLSCGLRASGLNLQAVCAAGLANMGKGSFLFAADHDGKFPRGTLEPNQHWLTEFRLGGHSGNMLLHLSDYVPVENFTCPAAPKDLEKAYHPNAENEECSFEVNAVLSDYLGNGGAKLSSVKKPSEVIYILDRGMTRIGLSVTARRKTAQTHAAGRTYWLGRERIHDGQLNLLHADGKVSLSGPNNGMIRGMADYGLKEDGTPLF